jgi:hypothetical protein
MKKYKIIIIGLAIILVCFFLVGFYYNYQISAVSRDDEPVVVEIKEGSIYSIGETLYKNGDASDVIAIFSACYPAREENLAESLYAAWIKHPNNSGNYGRNFGKRRFRELTASEKQKFYDYLKILNEWLSENYCSVVES